MGGVAKANLVREGRTILARTLDCCAAAWDSLFGASVSPQSAALTRVNHVVPPHAPPVGVAAHVVHARVSSTFVRVTKRCA